MRSLSAIPTGPTGQTCDGDDLRVLIKKADHAEHGRILDETFIEYCEMSRCCRGCLDIPADSAKEFYQILRVARSSHRILRLLFSDGGGPPALSAALVGQHAGPASGSRGNRRPRPCPAFTSLSSTRTEASTGEAVLAARPDAVSFPREFSAARLPRPNRAGP